MNKLNVMCYNCKNLNNDCKGSTNPVWTGCIYKEEAEEKSGMFYTEQNPRWCLNNKIKAKFSRLSYSTDNYIYVGLFTSVTGWTKYDFIDIMSYFHCVGFEEITREEAEKNSMLPVDNFQTWLKLEKEER